MNASDPQDLPELFLEGLNSGDVDSVVALYEPAAIVAPDPESVVAGGAAIRTMVDEFARRQSDGHWLVVIDRPLPAG